MKDPPVVRQGDDQHLNLAIILVQKIINVLNTGLVPVVKLIRNVKIFMV